MEEEEDYAQKPLLATSSSSSSYDLVKKTGNFWTTTAHIITAVIGSGVLSLAWSVAQLGWIGGPLSMLIFAAVTVLSSWLLADCYRSPDPETGSIINHTYMQAVRQHLG
ncbi:amino acid permease 3-like isoform X2 [Nymphaea colorata]|nr:amino acid permease 3-like isoform X2 [Nymphaea colorata]